MLLKGRIESEGINQKKKNRLILRKKSAEDKKHEKFHACEEVWEMIWCI